MSGAGHETAAAPAAAVLWQARLSVEDAAGAEVVARLRDQARSMAAEMATLPLDVQIAALNAVRFELHQTSPFKAEPVDFVCWCPADEVVGNDYNPNAVAPPEQKLLAKSITEDGYTQPVVTHVDGEHTEVVDGFHRTKVAKENKAIRARVHGHLPIVGILPSQTGRPNRQAATIRHNRARGTHSIELMKHIVAELVQAGMSDAWILRHIGMDIDELLRLKQITGLAALFADRSFSKAWVKDKDDAAFYADGTGR